MPRWTREEILQNLAAAEADWSAWHGSDPSSLSEDRLDDFLSSWRKYERAIVRAIRAGISDHPAVKAWVAARRSVGDYASLRKLKAGLETGMRVGPRLDGQKGLARLDEVDLWISANASRLVERLPDSKKGRWLQEIRQRLMELLETEPWPREYSENSHWTGEAWDREEARLKAIAKRRLGSKQSLHRRLAAFGIAPSEKLRGPHPPYGIVPGRQGLTAIYRAHRRRRR